MFRHDFTARACIPLRGAALEIAEHVEKKSAKVRLKISLFSAFGELCGEFFNDIPLN